MKKDRWIQIEEIYHAALDRDPNERKTFLERACGGDVDLQRQVTVLLQYDDQAEEFLKKPALEVAAAEVAAEPPTSVVNVDQTEIISQPPVLGSGTLIRHFRIIRKIGQGGMGEVYQAEDLKLARNVALKLLPQEIVRSESATQRFLREAQAASSLNHPNIVTIHAIEEVEGVDFIVMEYVEGITLSELIARGPLPFSRLIDLALQLTDALRAAHQIGIIHRDIKPSNILIGSRDQVKVLDFGLAKRIQSRNSIGESPDLHTNLTETGLVLGTVAYMSPEQTRGEPLDERSDLFSLGVVLYQAATGRMPFSAPSQLSLMHEIATSDPSRPSLIQRDLPMEFDVLIEKVLAKERHQRYRNAGEMMEALRILKQATSSAQIAIPRSDVVPEISASSAIVGREPELKRLGDSLLRAIEGTGGVVFITGEPGIGKTALADEFLRRARLQYPSLILSRGHCVEQYGTGEAYLPFLDALGPLLMGSHREAVTPVMRTYAPTWCLQFPGSFSSAGALEQLQRETIGATKDRMLRELADAMGALATSSPVLLILEDLHWADPSSIDLLRHLCQRIAAQRLLLVGTFRPEDVEMTDHPLKKYKIEMQLHKQCDEIALGSLNEDSLIGYLNARFTPNDFPNDFAAMIQHKTEGHPLFATSLLEFLADRGDIARTNDHWSITRPLPGLELEAPESVRSMIRKKIDGLEEEDRRALQYASIEGEEFLSTIVADLLGVDDIALEERLHRLGRLHLVEPIGDEELPDGTLAMKYRFSHALYQNVLYGDLVTKRRALLHRKAGEVLQRHFGDKLHRIASQLAMHFERGRDYTEAIKHFIQSGANATRLFASEEAEKQYTHALSLIEKLPAEEQARTSLVIYQQRGAVNMDINNFVGAVDDYTQMLNRAEEIGESEQALSARIGMIHALYWSHRLDEMAVQVDEAMRAVEQSGTEALRLEMLGLVAAKGNCYGELAESKPLLDEIIQSARRINHRPALLNGLVWRGQLYFFQTEYRQAEEILTECLKVAEELRNGFHLLHSLFFLGLLRANMGRMSEALATLNEAIAMANRNGDRFWVSRLPNCIGFIHNELQDFEGAVQHNRRGVDVARRDQVLEAESNSLINLGSTYLQTGEKDETLPAFKTVEENFARDAWFRWRYNIRLQAGKTQYWLSQGDLDQAETYAQKLMETARLFDAGKYIAVAHNLLSEIAVARNDVTAAERELNRALEVLGERPVAVVLWKTYAALGRLHARSGNEALSREAFSRAKEIVDGIASNVDEEALRQVFLSSAAVQEVVAGSVGVKQTRKSSR